MLVENGADVNRCDSNGVYPIHIAINRKNDAICDYLLAHAALINVTDKYASNSTIGITFALK